LEKDCIRFCAGITGTRDAVRESTEISNTPAGVPVWMTIEGTIDTGLSLFQRLWEAWYYFVAVLIGLFMVLWGIFFNGWDWLLIGAGAGVFLIFGWYTYRTLAGTGSG
jgi:hypothetical protein